MDSVEVALSLIWDALKASFALALPVLMCKLMGDTLPQIIDGYAKAGLATQVMQAWHDLSVILPFLAGITIVFSLGAYFAHLLSKRLKKDLLDAFTWEDARKKKRDEYDAYYDARIETLSIAPGANDDPLIAFYIQSQQEVNK